MKTAEETYYDLCDKHIENMDRKTIVVMAMHEYTSEACKEQKKICRNRVRGFSKSQDRKLVSTAPEPSMP